MLKLTEIFSDGQAAEIKGHFFSLRRLFALGNIRLVNRMQRLTVWIHEALLYDRLDILADFLEEINIAMRRLCIRCVRFENKEEADEAAKTLDYFDWLNFLRRYNIPSDDLSDEKSKCLRIGQHHFNDSDSIGQSHTDHVVYIEFSPEGAFCQISFFEEVVPTQPKRFSSDLQGD